MSNKTRTVGALALALTAGSALAQAPVPQAQALYIRTLAATCANCHGTDGRPVTGSAVPPLAGVPRQQTLANLRAFRDGTRPGTIMQQIVKGFDDAQLDALATYFAAQKP